MSRANEKIWERTYLDIRKRVHTYWAEISMNDASFSDSFKRASEMLHTWAPTDMKFLCDWIDELTGYKESKND